MKIKNIYFFWLLVIMVISAVILITLMLTDNETSEGLGIMFLSGIMYGGFIDTLIRETFEKGDDNEN